MMKPDQQPEKVIAEPESVPIPTSADARAELNAKFGRSFTQAAIADMEKHRRRYLQTALSEV